MLKNMTQYTGSIFQDGKKNRARQESKTIIRHFNAHDNNHENLPDDHAKGHVEDIEGKVVVDQEDDLEDMKTIENLIFCAFLESFISNVYVNTDNKQQINKHEGNKWDKCKSPFQEN